MRYIIKNLYYDVKIVKRYAGRLTLATLQNSLFNKKINKEDIKKLSEIVGEKIVIKKSKEKIKMPEEIKPVKPNTIPVTVFRAETVSAREDKTESVHDDDKEKKLIDYIINRNEADIKKDGYRFFLTKAIGKINVSFIRVETTNRRFEYFYKLYETDNLIEKKQAVADAVKIFLNLILQDKPS
jgi:hypothetical protein